MPCLPTVEGRAFDPSCLRLHRFSPGKTTTLLALLATVLPIAGSALAANYVWDGNAPSGSGSSRWSRSVNWSNNVAPPANNIAGLTNADVTFAGSLKTTPILTSSYYIRSLAFASNAASFTVRPQSTQVLTIGAGGIVNNSGQQQSILSTLNLGASQQWNAAAGNLVISGGVNLNAYAVTIGGANNLTISSVVQGAGSLVKQGAGNLTLAGPSANTFSGGVTLSSGTITAAKSGAFGTGALIVSGGTLNLGGFGQTVSSLSLSGGTITGTGSLVSSAAYQLQSGTLNMSLGGGVSLTKSTPGTVTVSSANSYSGGTFINAGTLAVNNALGSGTGPGNVSINSGGTLAGTGSIGGMVTNRSGGTISAGWNIGQLNTGTQFWLGGSTNRWEIRDASSTAGVGWDLLNISGSLNILAQSSNKTALDVVSFTLGGTSGGAANFDASQSYLWKIAQTTGGINFPAGENATTVFELMTGGFANPLNGGRFDLATSNGGRDLNLAYTPAIAVPEPHMLAFITLATCAYIYGRRFKRHWRSDRRPTPRPVVQPSSTATAAA
jgi:autotransporter-associated beta strand protein